MQQLTTLFITTADYQIQSEVLLYLIKKLKQDLWNCISFNAMSLFRSISDDNQFITDTSLAEYLQNNQISCDFNMASKLIMKFDKDLDHALNFTEFLQIIVPKQNTNVLMVNNCLQESIRELFICILTWESIIQEVKQEVQFIDYHKLLNELFRQKKTICIRRLRNFIQQIYPITNEQTMALFKQIDIRRQQRITRFDIYKEVLCISDSREPLEIVIPQQDPYNTQISKLITSRVPYNSFLSDLDSTGTHRKDNITINFG